MHSRFVHSLVETFDAFRMLWVHEMRHRVTKAVPSGMSNFFIHRNRYAGRWWGSLNCILRAKNEQINSFFAPTLCMHTGFGKTAVRVHTCIHANIYMFVHGNNSNCKYAPKDAIRLALLLCSLARAICVPFYSLHFAPSMPCRTLGHKNALLCPCKVHFINVYDLFNLIFRQIFFLHRGQYGFCRFSYWIFN